jgi:hypothetical protein
MAPSPFFQLRNYLAKKDVLAILRHFLGERLPDAPDLLDKAVFLGLDLEWWEYPPHGPNGPITELGLAIFKGPYSIAHYSSLDVLIHSISSVRDLH